VESSTYHSESEHVGVVGLDDEPTYRSISVLAIVSIVIGVAAPLCMMAPLLFVLPIVGIAVALLALRGIEVSAGTLIGRKAALIGIAISVASIGAALTRTKLSEVMLSQQARGTALEWIALLQDGKVDDAFEMTMASRKGPPPPSPMNMGPSEPPQEPIDAFRANPVVHFLAEHGEGADVKYVENVAFDPGVLGAAMVAQEYDVAASQETDGEPTTRIKVALSRIRGGRGASWQWLVTNYESDALASHEHDHAGHAHSH
jgi:hypothetical protein